MHNRPSAKSEPPRTGTEAFATGTKCDVGTIEYDSANLNRSWRFAPELDGTRQAIAGPTNKKNRTNILHVGTWNVRTLNPILHELK